MAEGDAKSFRAIVSGAVNRQAGIDQMTDRALVAKWPIDRIDPVIRALFRAAGSELLESETPPKVVINEFVDIAKAFFPEAESRNSSMRSLTTWRARPGPSLSAG